MRSLIVLKNQGLKAFLNYEFRNKKLKLSRFLKRREDFLEKFIILANPNRILPQNYKFVVFLSHLSGHAALGYFFTLCGLNSVCIVDSEGVSRCSSARKQLKNSPKNNYLSLYNYPGRSNDNTPFRFASQFIANTKILILTRDPISRIKTLANHGWTKPKLKQVVFINERISYKLISLSDDIYEALDKVRYGGGHNKPNLNAEFSKETPRVSFSYLSLLKPFLKPHSHNEVFYIDMQELMPENAFETMKNLAKKFDFTPPKEEDKDKFSQIVFNKFIAILPLILKITKKDFNFLTSDLELEICEDYSKNLNLTNLKEILIENDTRFYDEVAILTSFESAKLIENHKEILEKLRTYFKEFFKALKYWVDFRLENRVKEEDILIFLKNNKQISLKLKAIFDKEFSHLKKTRPDIIASWKYYAEFEKICEGF